MKKSIVCDIANIACFNKRKEKPRLSYIDLVYERLGKLYNLIGIADNCLYHTIDEKKRYKAEYLNRKIIFEAPAKIAADVFILEYAKINNCYILSNDLFGEYKQYERKWVKSHRIPFMIIDEQLMVAFNHEFYNEIPRSDINLVNSYHELEKMVAIE